MKHRHLSLLANCDCIQRAEFKQSAHECCEVIRRQTCDVISNTSFDGQSSRRRVAPSPLMTHRHGDPRRSARCRGVLLNRFEASGEYLAVGPKVPTGCSTQLQIRCRESRSIRGGSSLASSSRGETAANHIERVLGLVFSPGRSSNLEPLDEREMQILDLPAYLSIRSPSAKLPSAIQAPAAALGGTGSPFSAASFSAQESSMACNSVQREFAAPKQSSRALPVPESQSAVTPVGISGSARGLWSAA